MNSRVSVRSTVTAHNKAMSIELLSGNKRMAATNKSGTGTLLFSRVKKNAFVERDKKDFLRVNSKSFCHAKCIFISPSCLLRREGNESTVLIDLHIVPHNPPLLFDISVIELKFSLPMNK